MELTREIYHTLENRYLTNSRIGDWLKCKRFFQERHITGQRPNGSATDALRVGQAVHTIAFYGEEKFRQEFVPAVRRNIKNPPLNVIELTEKQYEDVLVIGEVLRRQPAMIECADHVKETIIKIDVPIGEHFVGLAGIPDLIKIDNGVCTITDLKTAFDSDDRKYHYKCLAFNYYQQFAVMTMILRGLRPEEIKKFVYRHIGIEKDPDGIFNPFVFTLANERVESFIDLVDKKIIPAIAAEKEFLPKSVDWKDAVVIGAMDEEIDF
jgi:hypothetical protein